MHIYFSGIGGTAIGPLALIAHQAGYQVSGSDKQDSNYIEYLKKHGVASITIGQTTEDIVTTHAQRPIDWMVYSSAVAIENPNHPELVFAAEHGIKLSKRDELLTKILTDSGQKLIAIAGTHGKTTTTAMAIWLFQQVGLPLSYSVGAKIPFGEMGQFGAQSEYFVYECDEFDRNFLAFHPFMSLIIGIDYDHHEIFPTREDYRNAFREFIAQSDRIMVWQSDIENNSLQTDSSHIILDDNNPQIETINLVGAVNRRNAWQVVQCVHQLTGEPVESLITKMELFPGLSRRFEKIADNLYTDYAHTIPKIAGCLQIAREMSQNVVVVYEPLTNRRQTYIADDYATLFNGVTQLYWVPSYLAREDPQEAILSPQELISHMDNPEIAQASELNESLKSAIQQHIDQGDLVVCMSGGGGGSLDEWLRQQFK